MKIPPYFLSCLLAATFALGVAFGGETPQPTQEKIGAFKNALTQSCQKNDIQGIKTLSFTNGAPAGLVDQSIGFWETLFDLAKNGRTFKEAQYITLEEELAKPGNPKALKLMTDPQLRNGHLYTPNLPIVGFATVTYLIGGEHPSEASNIFAVGLDQNGNLKFPEWKRTDGGAATPAAKPAAQSAKPLPASSIPTEKAISDFTQAIRTAFLAANLGASKSLFYFDNVPEELVDAQLARWEVIFLNDRKKRGATLTGATFTPLEEYLSKLGNGRKEAEASMRLKSMNGRPYHYSLPIVGMVHISTKTEHGTGGLTCPVGITPTGELRFVIPTPAE